MYLNKGMKISINDKNGIIRLIIHIREEEKSYCKTYYQKTIDIPFKNRKEMLIFLKTELDFVMLYEILF